METAHESVERETGGVPRWMMVLSAALVFALVTGALAYAVHVNHQHRAEHVAPHAAGK